MPRFLFYCYRDYSFPLHRVQWMRLERNGIKVDIPHIDGSNCAVIHRAIVYHTTAHIY